MGHIAAFLTQNNPNCCIFQVFLIACKMHHIYYFSSKLCFLNSLLNAFSFSKQVCIQAFQRKRQYEKSLGALIMRLPVLMVSSTVNIFLIQFSCKSYLNRSKLFLNHTLNTHFCFCTIFNTILNISICF